MSLRHLEAWGGSVPPKAAAMLSHMCCARMEWKVCLANTASMYDAESANHNFNPIIPQQVTEGVQLVELLRSACHETVCVMKLSVS